MLDKEMKRLIDQSDPFRNLVVVVMLDATRDIYEVAKISDRAARSRALEQAVWKLKRPVLEMIKRYRHVGLIVVNELDNSPSLVVAGPARAWQVLMEENADLANDPRVELVPNQANWHLAQ
ncbi:hypothetical protein FZ934_20885 (plasmid) [Rhizobium grahamii]|uniref:Uncharacterized protein n=1 Tax=Rhizobium grahamii TaxID=1120045 RepID=A0A5Q0CBJ2_9HYPH|nr:MULTISPECIES: hypothetical protein [Rhizobium]QFY62812.1 hypothetical protein FZ934_20885 [Rhizobium grahamii]QRM52441.1 hypothetical protein F3Y33_24770 [Rhizobium sp. BG6]